MDKREITGGILMDTEMILQEIANQILGVFAAGTLNIVVVLGITILTQIIKLNIKAISRRILFIPVILSAGITVFSFFVLNAAADSLPIIFFGYLGGSVCMYFLLKKVIPGFFKSNYKFINDKKNEKKK